MKKSFSELPLRKGVGIILLNDKNKVFVAKRIDNPKNFWQMPQGGKDENENYFDDYLWYIKARTGSLNFMNGTFWSRITNATIPMTALPSFLSLFPSLKNKIEYGKLKV